MLIKEEVEVVEIQDIPAVCIQHVGPYKGDSDLFGDLFGKLFNWAGPKGLIRFPETKMLTVYPCDADIAGEQNQTISVCITVSEPVEPEAEIREMKIAGGKYAIGHFELRSDEYEKAWAYLYEEWLPKSGFQPDGKPSFELYLNDPETHPEKKHIVDIYIPIK